MEKRRFTFPAHVFLSLLVIFTYGSAEGSLITSFDTNGLTSTTVSVPGVAPDSGITANTLVRGAGLVAASGANQFNSNSWNSPVAPTPATDTEYLSFGFTVDANTLVTVSTLMIRTRSSGTGPGTLGLYTNQDGYTAPIFTFNQAGTSGSGTGDLDSTIDLSILGPITGSSIDFRIIEIGNTQSDGVDSTGSTGTFRVQNFGGSPSQPISFEGTISAVAVPEPTTGLSMIALIGAAVLRRKRRAPVGNPA